VTKPTSQDITRLPKWAQDRIRLLEANLRSAQRDLDAMTGDPANTDTLLWNYQNEKGLPRHANIRFRTGPKGADYIDARLDDIEGCVVIHGGDRLAIVPSASNVIKIYNVRMEDHHGNG
jgi:hypothetical protein